MQISTNVALAQLLEYPSPFKELFTHGTLSIEIYKPVEHDKQQPHSRDEVYIVIAGTGKFLHGETISNFSAGDFIFVKAGVEHRFLEFSSDFSTWVIFYGPEGGEK
jgi:mannose-6-phosphate isomerase-like protein (cupin superfamily)